MLAENVTVSAFIHVLPIPSLRSQFEEATDWRAVFGNVQPTLTSDVKKQLKIDLIVRVSFGSVL